MDAYELHDGRQIQLGVMLSPANSLYVNTPAVPDNQVRTILAAGVVPSVAETQDFWWAILPRGSIYSIPVTEPVSFAADPAVQKIFPFVREGMELILYPGESLYAFRGAATAGSTITLRWRFIDTDLPFYSYVEPQKKIVRTQLKHGAVYRSSGGISPSGGGGVIGGGHPVGGGGGGAEPV